MEDGTRNTVVRCVSLLLIIVSISTTAASIATENWLEFAFVKISPDGRVTENSVMYRKGLWSECLVYKGVLMCGTYGFVKKLTLRDSIHPHLVMEPAGYIGIVRGLMIASLAINCLSFFATIILLVAKRQFYMDLLSSLALLSNMLLIAGLSVFTYWNKTIGFLSVRAGYSQILGWMSCALLLVANMCSFIARLDPERERKKQAIYA